MSKARVVLAAAFVAVGVASVVYGAWLVFQPAAYLLGGLVLVVVGLVVPVDRNRRGPARDPATLEREQQRPSNIRRIYGGGR